MWCELWVLVGLFCRHICFFFLNSPFLLDLVPVRRCGLLDWRCTDLYVSDLSISHTVSMQLCQVPWNSVVSGLLLFVFLTSLGCSGSYTMVSHKSPTGVLPALSSS